MRSAAPRAAVKIYCQFPTAHELGATGASSGDIANLALARSVDLVLRDVMAFRGDVFDGVAGLLENVLHAQTLLEWDVAQPERGDR